MFGIIASWKKIPRTVIFLGLVSCFNDLSSEMIYPIVPIFLTSVLHASVPILGLIEGIAEATAAVGKFVFGSYSDYLQKRKPFVVAGYSFGAASKLLIGLAATWHFVLFARFIDRLGKGLRTSARDSILLENTESRNKGFIFGFHRAFDSLGAVLGPLVALFFIAVMHDNLRLVFIIAFVPSVVAVLLLYFFVKEQKRHNVVKKFRLQSLRWSMINSKLKLFILISFLFSAGNSSDAFLLLRAKYLGLSVALVIIVYVLYNLMQTVFATPLGKLADRIGAKHVFSLGLVIFAVVYFFFGLTQTSFWLWLLFPIYGIYIAATDGVSKAYIGEFISHDISGTFYGFYYFITAIGTFLASFIGGLLWQMINPSATFYFGSIMAFAAFLIFTMFPKKLPSTMQSKH
ncbi:MAG TPA: MFS transporter [Candidatus Acidoferrales bacterium]|nr:MFS transporter [Candidatus Acidoferrales bacterium]